MADLIHLVCPRCDALNRVPATRLGQHPKCGKCHTPLTPARPLKLNGSRFHKHLAKSDLPLLVDFWASWCGPCQSMAPAFEKAAGMLAPRVRLIKVNTEEEQAVAAQYGIQSIPTMVLFHRGREKARVSGAMPAESIAAWARQQLGG